MPDALSLRDVIVDEGTAPRELTLVDVTVEEEGRSVGGFLKNVGTSGRNVLSGLGAAANPKNWPGIVSGMAEGQNEAWRKLESGEPMIGRYNTPSQAASTFYDDPVGAALEAAPMVPGLAKIAPGALRATARGGQAAGRAVASGARSTAAGAAQMVASHPTAASMMAGAAPGVIAGNPAVAVGGAALGFERAPAIGRRFSKLAKQLRGPDTPAAVPAAARPSTLLDEIMSRDPDWRTVDAVPIDAIKRDLSRGGSIIEAGESRVALGERIATLLKTPTAANLAEADRLAKAMRQRMHISAGRPSR